MITLDVFTRGVTLIRTMLQKTSQISNGRQSAIVEILMLFLSFRGRINFSQMGRQGDRYEKTYRYHFEKDFDWSTFNSEIIKEYCSEELIIGFDPSYISKSGKKTPGLGYYYSGVAGSYKRGMEIGNLAIIDIKQNTAYHYEAVTTPSSHKEHIDDDRTVVDHYADLIIQRASSLVELSTILVVDGYFAKRKFVDKVICFTELEIICRLRDDANLKYLAPKVSQKKRGRPKLYSGKVNVKNIDKDQFNVELYDEEKIVYSLVVYSVGLKRKIKVCYVEFLNKKGEVYTRKIFFSTNLDRSGISILKYYKARFQMEFIFRDAKQHTGLEHCQSRSQNKLNFHFNASLTSVNIAKMILRNNIPKNESIPLSIGDLKIKLQNRNTLYRIFSIYGLDHKLIKINQPYEDILNFGCVAA